MLLLHMLLKLVLASITLSTSFQTLLAPRDKAEVWDFIVLRLHMSISIAQAREGRLASWHIAQVATVVIRHVEDGRIKD
jgi:hypothetical protein